MQASEALKSTNYFSSHAKNEPERLACLENELLDAIDK